MVLVKSQSVGVIVPFCFVSLSIKMGTKKEIYTEQKIYIGTRGGSEESFYKTDLC